MPRRKNASPRAKTASADQLQQTSLRSFFPPIEGAAEKGGTKAGGAAKKEAGGAAKKRGKKEVGETSLTQCVPKQKTFRWAGVDTGMSEREFFAYNPPKEEGSKRLPAKRKAEDPKEESKKRGAAAAKVEAKQKPPAKKAKGDGNANAKKKEKKEQDEFGKSLAPKTLFHAGNGSPGEML